MKTLQGRCKNAVRYLEDGKQKDLGSTGFASAEELVDVDLVASYFVCSLTRPSPSRRPEDSGAEEEAYCECEGTIEFNRLQLPVQLSTVPLRSAVFLFCSPPPVLSCNSVWDDSGDEEDEDAPVLAVDTANTRGARCGKYTAGTAAAQAGVNIVDGLWRDSGKDCRYATRQFEGDVESALLNEFPDNCRDTGAVSAFVDRD